MKKFMRFEKSRKTKKRFSVGIMMLMLFLIVTSIAIFCSYQTKAVELAPEDVAEYNILEIVPDTDMASIGYLIGGQEPIKDYSFLVGGDYSTYTSIFGDNGAISYWDQGGTTQVQNNEIFKLKVLGVGDYDTNLSAKQNYLNNLNALNTYNASHKITVVTKTPDQVTTADVKNANYVCVNVSESLQKEAVILADDYWEDQNTVSGNVVTGNSYHDVTVTGDTNFSKAKDFTSFEIAYEIYRKIALEESCISISDGVREVDPTSSIYKLYWILNMTEDPLDFKKYFIMDGVNGEYTDKVLVDNKTGKIKVFSAFGSVSAGEYSTFEVKYFQVTSDLVLNPLNKVGLVRNNVFVLAKNSSMVQDTILPKLFDLLHFKGLIRKIRVLEIEPTTSFSYSGTAGQIKFAKECLGLSENDLEYSLLIGNNKLEITSVSVSGFCSMRADLLSTYDIIYIGMNYSNIKQSSTGIPLYNNALKNGEVYGVDGDVISVYYSGSTYNGSYIGATSTGLTELSGNDITKLKLTQIQDFANAGMPVLLNDKVYNKNIKLTGATTELIDKDSNLYSFLSRYATTAYSNVMNELEIKNTKTLFKYLVQKKGTVPEIQVTDTSDKSLKSYTSTGLNASFISNKTLNVNFSIGNVPSNHSGSYKAELYVDWNSDNKFSAEELERTKSLTGIDSDTDIVIKVSNIIQDFDSFLTWKLKVTNLDANGKTSEYIGYTAVKGSQTDVVKVLQIMPNSGSTLNMQTNTQFQGYLKALNTSNYKYDIQVTTITVQAFNKLFQTSPFDKTKKEVTDQLNNKYNMIVLGLGDSFGGNDITNRYGAIDNLKYFISTGKSVLFAHDTMSFLQNSSWAYELTTNFVPIFQKNYDNILGYKVVYNDGKVTQGLNNNIIWRYRRTLNSILLPFTYTTWQSSSTANYFDSSLTRAAQVNQGRYAMYPYEIKKESDGFINISATHSQYYQLDLENPDVMVWYTVANAKTGNYTANYSTQTNLDGINNYYIYSLGNVLYTGAGHSTLTSATELKLFVNTLVAAANVANRSPYIEVEGYSEFAEDTSTYTVQKEQGLEGTIKFQVTDVDTRVENNKISKVTIGWDIDESMTLTADDIPIDFIAESSNPESTLSSVKGVLTNLVSNKTFYDITLADSSYQEIVKKYPNAYILVEAFDEKGSASYIKIGIEEIKSPLSLLFTSERITGTSTENEYIYSTLLVEDTQIPELDFTLTVSHAKVVGKAVDTKLFWDNDSSGTYNVGDTLVEEYSKSKGNALSYGAGKSIHNLKSEKSGVNLMAEATDSIGRISYATLKISKATMVDLN